MEGDVKIKEKENKVEKQEPIGVISLIIAHFLLGAGIAIIGQRTKNKMEFYGGLVFILVYIGIFIFEFTSKIDLVGCLRGLLGLGSWIYIIIRLALLINGKYDIKAL